MSNYTCQFNYWPARDNFQRKSIKVHQFFEVENGFWLNSKFKFTSNLDEKVYFIPKSQIVLIHRHKNNE